MHSWLLHMMDFSFSCIYPTFAQNCLSQTASFVQWLIAIYSASVVDNAMIGCFLHFQEISSTPMRNTFPVVDLRSFVSPTQFLKAILFPLKYNLKSTTPFKYLMMFVIAIQCGWPTFNMNKLIVLTANVISALVATIAYTRGLIMALYRTHFISLCKFSNPSSDNFYNFELIHIEQNSDRFAFFHVGTLEDLLDIGPLGHMQQCNTLRSHLKCLLELWFKSL